MPVKRSAPGDLEPIERASRDEIAALQLQRLRSTLQHAYDQVPHYRQAFDARDVHPDDLKQLSDLAKFPFTVKKDLRDNYPFGLLAVPRSQVARIHASSGTTGKPTVVGYTKNDIDTWADLVARSIRAAGGRAGDMVHIAYGYGLFTGGLGAHYGAERAGCTVIPMSGGQTEIEDLPVGRAGQTPGSVRGVDDSVLVGAGLVGAGLVMAPAVGAPVLLHLGFEEVTASADERGPGRLLTILERRVVPVVVVLDDLEGPATLDDVASHQLGVDLIGQFRVARPAQQVHGLSQGEVRHPGHSMEAIEVTAGVLHHLEGLGHLSQCFDRRVVHTLRTGVTWRRLIHGVTFGWSGEGLRGLGGRLRDGDPRRSARGAAVPRGCGPRWPTVAPAGAPRCPGP